LVTKRCSLVDLFYSALPMAASTEIADANVARRLTEMAGRLPAAVAIAQPRGYAPNGSRRYDTISFAELEADATRIARGLIGLDVRPGTRLALLVRPSIDFIALVFGLLRSGAVTVLIDPGMGRKNLLTCLDEVRPAGFVAIPAVQAVRVLLKRRYRAARINVTVGRRWFWNGPTLKSVRQFGAQSKTPLPHVSLDDPAAIIFTSGSTGPPKGVLYTQRTFNTQVEQIQSRYRIEPGEVDLPGFPLFGLFNAAMGVTTVIPDMDPTRPAKVDPQKIIEAVDDWSVTQTFGSPAMWNRVGGYCEQNGARLATVRRVLSAGAPVPADVQRQMKASIHAEGEMHTPYGATESLPVATISASEVLAETAARTARGAGVCVGRKFDSIDWKVIAASDGPLESMDKVEELPAGEIGELIVRGPQVTREYATRTEWNARSKIRDGDQRWHRMGDVGYFDEEQRFWFCGRKAHRVQTDAGTLYPVCCEAIFNTHQEVYRSALVGVGPAGAQRPVLVVELHDAGVGSTRQDELRRELLKLGSEHSLTQGIRTILLHPGLPVDVRHNSKIHRESLAEWAAERRA
jgi:acyl-CoA synthetase (AMP-forming)/AMP-acid ligase II